MMDKNGPERVPKTREYDKLWMRVDQKERDLLWIIIIIKTRDADLLWIRMDEKEPSRPGNTIYYGQEQTRKSYPDRNTILYEKECARKTMKMIRYVQEWARKSH